MLRGSRDYAPPSMFVLAQRLRTAKEAGLWQIRAGQNQVASAHLEPVDAQAMDPCTAHTHGLCKVLGFSGLEASL